MKKILIIHNKYRNIGGEDTSVANEVNFLNDYYEIEILYFENKALSSSPGVMPSILTPQIPQANSGLKEV